MFPPNGLELAEIRSKNGLDKPSWTDTDSDKLNRTVKQANHKNANGGNGRYGVDQGFVNRLDMPQQEKEEYSQG